MYNSWFYSVLSLFRFRRFSSLGLFTNYVGKVLALFDPYPPPLTFSTFMNIDKKSSFLDYIPSPFVNMVCERPSLLVELGQHSGDFPCKFVFGFVYVFLS